MDQIMEGLSNQDTYIFEDQDLIITQHSQISSYILKDKDGNDITDDSQMRMKLAQ